MNSFRRRRTGRVDPSWSRTVERAFGYAFQLGRKVRVVSVPHARGWAWRADVGEKLTDEQRKRAWEQHDLAHERRRARRTHGIEGDR